MLDMIGLFARSVTTSLVAKNGTKKLSHLFEELQGSNSEFEIYIITRTYIETNLGGFGLAGLLMMAILDF